MIDLKKIRCRWCGSDPLLIQYHDEEWGKYARDDQEYRYFEKLALEIFQAGLSWRTILHKRENFRAAFDEFDVDTIAQYDDNKIAQLLGNQSIIRNRMKIEAIIYNAREIIRLRREYGSFTAYLAQLNVNNMADVYTEFKKRFRFMGPTVTESFLQTVGKLPVIHEPQCWLYESRG